MKQFNYTDQLYCSCDVEKARGAEVIEVRLVEEKDTAELLFGTA